MMRRQDGGSWGAGVERAVPVIAKDEGRGCMTDETANSSEGNLRLRSRRGLDVRAMRAGRMKYKESVCVGRYIGRETIHGVEEEGGRTPPK
jgi:hypothetical protein